MTLPMTPAPMTANELTRSILEDLTAKSWHVWRCNAGFSGKHNVKLAPNGTPDIIGFSSSGRFVGLEIKIGKDELRPKQIEFLTALGTTQFGIAAVITSKEHFDEWYSRGEESGFCPRPGHLSKVWKPGKRARTPDSKDKSVAG